MGKYLVKPDYEKIVIDALKLPFRDLFNYYRNIAEEYWDYNPELFERIITEMEIFDRWAEYVSNNPYELDNYKNLHVDETGGIFLSLYHSYAINQIVPVNFFSLHIARIQECQKKLERLRMSKSKARSNKALQKGPKTLIEIWKTKTELGENDYQCHINYLKKTGPWPEEKFLLEEHGRLVWNRKIRGSINYLAGWLHLCIKNGMIMNDLSAPRYVKVLNNEFNARIKSPTPFKGIHVTPPADKYLQPFLENPWPKND